MEMLTILFAIAAIISVILRYPRLFASSGKGPRFLRG